MYIYKTTNLINGKIYIGQCIKQPEQTTGYLGSGRKIKLAITKYGKSNFIKHILKRDIPTQGLLDTWEQIFIVKYNSHVVGYNILRGTANKFGSGSPMLILEIKERTIKSIRIAMQKPEVREKLSIAGKTLIGVKNPNYGNNWTVEQKQAMSDKLSDGRRKGENNANFGNKWTNKQKKNLSKKKSIPIEQLDPINLKVIETYKSSVEASRLTGINRGSITGATININKTGGGFKWRYKYENKKNK